MNLGRIKRRWMPVVFGALLVAFGLACFNYTKPGTLLHHQEWATQNDRPAPSDTVFWTGVGSAVLGAFTIGWALGRSR